MGSFPYRKTAFSGLTQSHHEYNKRYPRSGSPLYDKWQVITYITSSIRNNEPNTEEGKNKLTLYPVGFEPTSSETTQPGLVALLWLGFEYHRDHIFFLFLFFLVPCFLYRK